MSVAESVAESIAPEQLTVEQAIANLRHDDTSLRYYAAWWLGKFRVAEPAAVQALIEVLEDEDDRTELGGYPLRRNAARALGKLGDQQAVPGLVHCLACEDFYVREAAAQALGKLGDSQAIPALVGLLSGGLAMATQLPGCPHLTQPYEAVIEALGRLGAISALDQIAPFRSHPVAAVQYAATRALYQLTQDDAYGEQLVQALRESQDVQLRRTILADLGAMGYVPAMEAIAQAPVENSFKLIALKGLLEQAMANDHRSDHSLPATVIRVMTLMDTLL